MRALHRWLGLLLMVPFVVLAVTGTLLVFEDQLDPLLNPELAVGEIPRSEWVSEHRVRRNAEQALGKGVAPLRLLAPGVQAETFVVDFYYPDGDGGMQFVRASVHPATGEVLAVRDWGSYFTSFIYRIHLAFFAGEPGEEAVGYVGLGVTLMLIAGLYLWWPRKRWAPAFVPGRPRTGSALSFRWHRVLGFYTFVLLLPVVLTGVGLSFHTPVEKAIKATLPTGHKADPKPSGELDTPLTLDEIHARARAAYPGAETQYSYFADGDQPYWQILMRTPERVHTAMPDLELWLHPETGEIIQTYDARRDARAGDHVHHLLFPIHNGQALGLPGRLVVLVLGLMVPFFAVTGFVIWRHRRARAARKRRADAGAERSSRADPEVLAT